MSGHVVVNSAHIHAIPGIKEVIPGMPETYLIVGKEASLTKDPESCKRVCPRFSTENRVRTRRLSPQTRRASIFWSREREENESCPSGIFWKTTKPLESEKADGWATWWSLE